MAKKVLKKGIVAFAFGSPRDIPPNLAIGGIASCYAITTKSPVFTQLDVPIGSGIEVKRGPEKPNEPPPTLRIAREAVRWAKELGIERLLIVAALPHLWRCRRDLRQAVAEVGASISVGVPILSIQQFPEAFWFCPFSVQSRSRSKKNWDRRERILKAMPFSIYKLVAS